MLLFIKGLVFLMVAAGPLIAFAQPLSSPDEERRFQADQFEAKVAQAIDENNISQGLDLMSKAVSLDPSGMRHMTYGSLLFGNGVSVFKEGDKAQGQRILRQAEAQLHKAIQLFDVNKDQAYLSQCYFLLGEMHLNAFGDKIKAKQYYQKAVNLSDYTGAKESLKYL